MEWLTMTLVEDKLHSEDDEEVEAAGVHLSDPVATTK